MPHERCTSIFCFRIRAFVYGNWQGKAGQRRSGNAARPDPRGMPGTLQSDLGRAIWAARFGPSDQASCAACAANNVHASTVSLAKIRRPLMPRNAARGGGVYEYLAEIATNWMTSMKSKRLLPRLGLAVLLLIVLSGISGAVWLRSSPYWAGITLFSEANRVENFRTMDAVFPYREIKAEASTWEFTEAPGPLPETYTFNGETHRIDAFLDETVTTGLVVVRGGAITHEEYRLGATEAARFTSWSMAKSILSALIGIAIDEGHIVSAGDPLQRYVPTLATSGYAGVTIEQALTMSSGVRFDEDYDNPLSDVNRLFFTLAAGMPLEEVLIDLERERPPGALTTTSALTASRSVSCLKPRPACPWKPIWNAGSGLRWARRPMHSGTPGAMDLCCRSAA